MYVCLYIIRDFQIILQAKYLIRSRALRAKRLSKYNNGELYMYIYVYIYAYIYIYMYIYIIYTYMYIL